MNSGISNLFSLVITQVPLLIVYAVGLMTAYSYRQQYPQAANRVTWAILLFLVDAIVLSVASQWILNRLIVQGAGEGELSLAVNGLGLARSLIHAWAFMLILGAVFPTAAGIRWPRRLIGAVLGLLIGGVAGVILGIPIGMAAGATTHDGALASFVVFFVLPIAAVIGAIVGLLVIGAPRPIQ
jgi:hypothetical protein